MRTPVSSGQQITVLPWDLDARQAGIGFGSGAGAGAVGWLAGAGLGQLMAWILLLFGVGTDELGSVVARVFVAAALLGAAWLFGGRAGLTFPMGGGLAVGLPLGAVFGFTWQVLAVCAVAGLLAAALSLTQIPVLARRELRALFYSPIAYVVATIFLGLMGIFLYVWLASRRGPGMEAEASLYWPLGMITWIVLPFLAPILTMRLFSEEMRTGTIEVLTTAPVRDWEVVGAKFLAAFGAFCAMLTPTLIHLLSLYLVSERGPAIAPLVGSYMGLLLTASFFISLGVLASSLTSNQIVAAMLGFTFSFGFFMLGWFAPMSEWVQGSERRKALVQFVSYDWHFRRFSEGQIDTRGIIFFLSLTLFILFLTTRIFESRKWR